MTNKLEKRATALLQKIADDYELYGNLQTALDEKALIRGTRELLAGAIKTVVDRTKTFDFEAIGKEVTSRVALLYDGWEPKDGLFVKELPSTQERVGFVKAARESGITLDLDMPNLEHDGGYEVAISPEIHRQLKLISQGQISAAFGL